MTDNTYQGREQDDEGPGPRRRRISGEVLIKRKIGFRPAELKQLEVEAEREEVSLSELLVGRALAPERESNRQMTAAEAKALAAELMPLRTALNDLVLAVKDDESTAALDEFMVAGKATSDRIYNAIESLVR